MGYYNPFPYLPADQLQQLLPLLDLLNQTLEKVNDAFGGTFVPTAKAFAKNPKVLLPNPQDIHPNTAGYKVLANEFWKKLKITSNIDFVDVTDGSWAEEEIDFLVTKGVIKGYGGGEFRFNDSI
jgi:hypothetical protein